MKNLTATLKKLIAEHGPAIIEQEQKIKAILADLHPNEKRLRYLLELSLRAKIPRKLIALQNESTALWETQIDAIKHFFKEEYFLEESAVNLVFNCWLEIIPCKKTKIHINPRVANAIRIAVKDPLEQSLPVQKFDVKRIETHPTEQGVRMLPLFFGNFHKPLVKYVREIGHTVQIGKQVWMASNLNATLYRNGDLIPYIKNNTDWRNLTNGACCDLDNYTPNGSRYGKLYNWLAVSDKRNIAPAGWHVATVEDWDTLITELGGEKVAGSRLIKNIFNFIDSGFSAKLGGRRSYQGDYLDMGKSAVWWRSSSHGSSNDIKSIILTSNAQINFMSGGESNGYYVRCVKD
jgi:uncharacterized protein (TIGR02145 family)